MNVHSGACLLLRTEGRAAISASASCGTGTALQQLGCGLVDAGVSLDGQLPGPPRGLWSRLRGLLGRAKGAGGPCAATALVMAATAAFRIQPGAA
jgi:hypothetical protein